MRMARFFVLSPGVGIYDDRDEPNALAYKQSFIPGTRGTVCIGSELMRRQMEGASDNGISVLAILAHEFGHILQYEHGLEQVLAPEGSSVKLLELHADFFAGLYIAHIQRTLLRVRLYDTGRTFEQLGDTDFASVDHHGRPEERVAAIEFGHSMGTRNPSLRPADALAKSVRYVKDTFENM